MSEKRTIAVWGAPGGGKTTLAVNMAVLLAEAGYMTCLVSAADHGQLQAFFGKAIPADKGIYAAMTNGRNVREALVEVRPNLCIFELDTDGDYYNVASIDVEQVDKIYDELIDQFTCVIVDCTSYMASPFTGRGLKYADKVVDCIPHRVSAALWHKANRQMTDAIKAKTVYVEVDTRKGGCNMPQLRESIELSGVPFTIPYVDEAFYCENVAKPIVNAPGRRPAAYKKHLLKLTSYLIDAKQAEPKPKKAKADKKKAKAQEPAEQPEATEKKKRGRDRKAKQ